MKRGLVNLAKGATNSLTTGAGCAVTSASAQPRVRVRLRINPRQKPSTLHLAHSLVTSSH